VLIEFLIKIARLPRMAGCCLYQEGLCSTLLPLLLADNMTRTQAKINGNNHVTRLLIKIFAIQ